MVDHAARRPAPARAPQPQGGDASGRGDTGRLLPRPSGRGVALPRRIQRRHLPAAAAGGRCSSGRVVDHRACAAPRRSCGPCVWRGTSSRPPGDSMASVPRRTQRRA